MSQLFKQYDIVEIIVNPGFSTIDRKGWKAIVLQKWSKEPYMAVQDKLGVSWPLVDDQVKKVGTLDL